MKYLFINSVYGMRSTGKLIADQCHQLQNEGHQCLAAYGREAIRDSDVELIKIGKKTDYLIHASLSRILDLHGFCSGRATERFLSEVEEYDPDVIWLHNLHGYYMQIEKLFQWLKKHPEIKVYWTLHDCWAFTGHCAYFTMAGCEKWKDTCRNCPQLREYPKTYGMDHSARNYRRKKAAFCGLKSLTLITPSRWLADLTRKSFLSEYPVKVIPNKIDPDIFKPVSGDFRQRHGIKEKYIVLGVAVGWEKTKGLGDFFKIRKYLSAEYLIVLVGATEKQINKFPEGILGIERTSNPRELAEIYTAADVFINPTHQDNYPTVNLEAAACGTPVVTYNVGGSPESVPPENVVEENDIKGMTARITVLCEEKGNDEQNRISFKN